MIKRLHPLAQYLMALAVAVGGYGLYLKFAVPLIEGPPGIPRAASSKIRANYQPPDLKDGFEKFFSADAWELQSCKIVKTAQGKILCQDWQPHDDGRVDVFPFTMVLDPKQPGNAPIVIRCMAGAQVFLDRPMTFGASENSGSGKNKIQRARLQGQVLVYRPPNGQGTSDAFHLSTTNIQIEKQEIHTIDVVEFQFGKHRGRGSNLRIELGAAEGASQFTSDLSRVETVNRIRLSNLDFLELHPEAKRGPAAGPGGRVVTQDTLLRSDQEPLRVSCRGAFDFDLTQNKATLEKSVLVQQLSSSADSLRCEQLELKFAGPPLSAPGKRDTENSELQIESIRAIGTPAVLKVASRESTVTGAELFFDQLKSVVFADSDSTVEQVIVDSPAMLLASKQVTYRLAEDQSLGDLSAKGPGRLVKRASNPREGAQSSDSFTASWERSLVVESDGVRKKISLDGSSKVSFDDQTAIQSQKLSFWVWPVPNQVVTTDESGAEIRRTKWEYLPSQLMATGDVVVESETVAGTARRLSANWPAIDPGSVQLGQAQSIPNPVSLPLVSMTRHLVQRPVQDWETVPDTPIDSRSSAQLDAKVTFPRTQKGEIGKSKEDRTKSKFIFDGDLVTIGFADHSSKPAIKELKIDGNVNVIESKSGRSTGTRIQGSSFHLSPQKRDDIEELYRVFVGGNSNQAASVKNESLQIQGAEIHLDQLQNKLWVNGAGTLAIQELARKESIDVQWKGGMIFDGSNIYFEHDVFLDASRNVEAKTGDGNKMLSDKAAYQLTRSRSQVLNLVLERIVNFSKLGQKRASASSNEDKIEFREIILIHKLPESKQVFQLAKHSANQSYPPVVIEIQSLDVHRKMVDKQRFVAPDARIEPESGFISAKGPGLISSHRKANSDSGRSPSPFQSPRPSGSNEVSKRATDGLLNYLRINFDKGVEASQADNEVKVIGNIRALFLTTKDWDLAVDPDQISNLPPGGGKLNCDQIRISKWQARGYDKPSTEFIAEGNAHVWGELFESTASRITYADQADLLVVEGTARSPAQLWHQTESGSSRQHVAARKIWYRPSERKANIEDISRASATLGEKSQSLGNANSKKPIRKPLDRLRKR